ncbi:hypothetical protein Tsubulata_007303 [Turnera subulata]|uniref:Ribosomal protein S7 n=1 Tax=Turnera subulata TaxID=218843 RepID=A0A9Q0JD51_9ROSI|nr:hypothetical protein Tsubulata_007303 [Turnera subulata]
MASSSASLCFAPLSTPRASSLRRCHLSPNPLSFPASRVKAPSNVTLVNRAPRPLTIVCRKSQRKAPKTLSLLFLLLISVFVASDSYEWNKVSVFDSLSLKCIVDPGNKPPKADPVYRNRLVNLFVNRILKNGKKSLAYYIIYQALRRIQQKTGSNPLPVLRDAVLQVTPDVMAKATRVGGSTQQVPVEVGLAQGRQFAIRWILEAARKRNGKSMVFKLSSELMDAAKGNGEAFRKKEAMHKTAEANRAFAQFR